MFKCPRLALGSFKAPPNRNNFASRPAPMSQPIQRRSFHCLAVCVALGLSFALAAPLAAAPGKLDTTRRSQKVSTDQEADLPGVVILDRADSIQNRREERLSSRRFDRETSALSGRRSAIDLTQTREKTRFRTPDRKTYDSVSKKESLINTRDLRFGSDDDVYRTTSAMKYQDKISAAQPALQNSKPVVTKRAGWASINRFTFRKNSDGPITVTKAGSDQAPAPLEGDQPLSTAR